VKSVVVLGKGDLAIKVCEWFKKSSDHDLVAIVPVIPEPSWTSSLLKWSIKNNVPAVSSGDYRDLSCSPDLAVSIFYDKIIRSYFIEKCGKIINLHNSPLPKYRGVSPINWALKNEEEEHGVTIHQMTPGLDNGPIFGQIKYSIYHDIDEVSDVYNRALEYAYALFVQTIPILDKIKPREQDELKSSYYSKKNNVLLGDRRFFTRKEKDFRTP
jgi:hypothetical protein